MPLEIYMLHINVPPQVQWERMDGLHLPFSRINFTSSNTTLVLKDVRSPDDIAIYTCRVQSEGGVVQILNYALALVGVLV